MSVIPKLAVSLGRRDEVPNVTLAEEITSRNDKAAVDELVTNLQNKDKKIVSDCIKVLYEIADRNAKLIAPHLDVFISLLDAKDNRLAWGAMTAIHSITSIVPDKVHMHLSKILAVAEAGSVITKDHATGILVTLATHRKYQEEASHLLLAQLSEAANNQFGMYAEQVATVLPNAQKDALISILNERLPLLEKDSQKNRIAKLLKKLNK